MNSKVQQAVEKFEKGFNCSQAVLSTYSEQFGLDENAALKIATGFGGGMHINGTCGAVTGAFMVLGLKYGNSKADEIEKKVSQKIVQMYKLHPSVFKVKRINRIITTLQGKKDYKKMEELSIKTS